MISLMRHEVRVRRRTILGWAFGLGFFSVMYMSLYPGLPEEMRNLDMASIEIYQSLGVESMATFEGYIQSTVLNFLPLLVGAFGIVLGAGALAGEEDAGTLEVVAALPISRLQLYTAKAVAVVTAAFLALLAVGAVTAAVFLAIESQIETPLTALDMFWVLLGHWLIAFVFAALALFLGAFLPSRGTALAVASSLLVVTFFANNLAGMVTELESVQPLFPFSYFGRIGDALSGELPWDDVFILLLMGIVLLVLGALSFRARDLTVAAWPWQRPQPSGEPARLVRPRAATGVMAAVAVVAIGVAAFALLSDGDWRFWESAPQAAREPDATAVATTETAEEDATAAPIATKEATPAPDDRAEATSASDSVSSATPAAASPPERVRATATLRILP